ncbi:hypothetical protein Hamer_G007088 [Homarus americanus]|uniref:Uncharacterized protein n=1 Tax=Homarus americanus TaxID=6706 RepID=A0A8J5JZ90_HOMAM|nr:hypothetical protein Hamer_G007088 [Homarus americanus]
MGYVPNRFLNTFSALSSACGLILSPDKSRIFSPRNPETLPEFTVGEIVLFFRVCSKSTWMHLYGLFQLHLHDNVSIPSSGTS